MELRKLNGMSERLLKKEDDTSLESPKKDPYVPAEKYLTLFSPEWNEYFASFDDRVIGIFQYFHLKKWKQSFFNKFFGLLFAAFAYICTFLTQIEYGPSLCIFLVTIGMDHLARWFIITGIITAIAAQFPKRFLFRKRPFMEKRALQIAKDHTSSFPSRAVVCGVVYSFAAVYAYDYHHGVSSGIGLIHFVVFPLLGGLSASFARIYLGVHYPSDCICGLVFGYLISISSFLIAQLPNIFGCPSCEKGACYVSAGTSPMTAKNFELQNIQLAFMTIVVFGVFQVFSNWPPLKFWDKSAPIFGTFSACILIEIMMTCPKVGARTLENITDVSSKGYLYAFLLTQANLFSSNIATKVYRKMNKMVWEKSIMWNVAIYLVFTLIFLGITIKLRLAITFGDV